MANVESLRYFLPELLLTALVLAVFLVDLGLKRKKVPIATLMVVGLLVSLYAVLKTPGAEGVTLFLGMVSLDPFSVFFKVIFIVTAVLVTLFSMESDEVEEKNFGEYMGFIAATTLGAVLLASSNHMLMAFLTLELVSVPCYVLAGYISRSRRSSEASLKYVIFGAASSGLMVYGISLLFGVTGSLSFEGIRDALSAGNPGEIIVLISLIFILAGLGYKIAVFPFHMWCPDVYEGAPTPITAFLSVGPKAAGFAVLVRMLHVAFSSSDGAAAYLTDISSVDWPFLVAIISAATMTIGNLLAINQSNIKRLLAYSSIAHAGYLLMGVVALSQLGTQALLFYFVVYLLMNLGAFLVVLNFRSQTRSEQIGDYTGLAWRSPIGAFVAVSMAIFLFSLTGIPPFGGFIGKVYLFASIIQGERFIWLAIVAIANSVISLYYYARIIKVMFLRGIDAEDLGGFVSSPTTITLLTILAVGTAVSGIFWGPIARWVSHSASLFFG
ncbi:MAG: NADH-quinone oxidoreductase subunit NuoN [Candidatus Latescibacteria bacterium]|nr:NADH-quinone oxidoreductase subunit NuoN [Candidatus Latescibacterota bacterium]NIM66387.1 NADH-quinone oxidoreductase subunit NuoN [Candidatus Latescibacterota bacterium]NIO02866.1 NADH-quinone oxidoreductase subunit NuoN [Candidatus Latescibacterota bacterium]NIO30001.1 NADH-quinone oxidoreductase subunit NuoN [Candidatus Latescibacterota bacterium]NIO57616.1 NADH-quinone oxidoreductase subunit NuoN [Candidatus Latescibacterota bacterium]